MDEPELFDPEDPIQQHLIFNKFFADLYNCDSKKVEDIDDELETSIIYFVNLRDANK
jgi:hypothetical protein